MLGLITKIFSGGIIESVGGVIKSIFGDRQDRDRYSYQQQIAAQDAYAAEFMAPEKKHWFNMFVDGANRLVRPLFTYGIVIMFWWAATQPEQFVTYIKTLQIVPEAMWGIMWTIIAFWFGGRVLENRSLPSSRIDPRIAGEFFRERSEGMYNPGTPIVAPVMNEKEFSREMAATTKTLSNPAIMEWNKRNNKR